MIIVRDVFLAAFGIFAIVFVVMLAIYGFWSLFFWAKDWLEERAFQRRMRERLEREKRMTGARGGAPHHGGPFRPPPGE